MKVMIVDDNPKMRETISVCIRPHVQEIVECGDGEEVLEAYVRNSPDVVLMDIRMPGVDGITAARSLHNIFPQSRIIFVTEYSDGKHRKMAEEAGAYGFVSKENLLDLNTLIKTVIL